LVTVFQCWHKLAVVIVEQNVFNADDSTSSSGLFLSSAGQGAATHLVVACIAIGD